MANNSDTETKSKSDSKAKFSTKLFLRPQLIAVIFFIVILSLAIYEWTDSAAIPTATMAGGLIAAVLIYGQLEQASKFNEAQLMLELYKVFSQNKEIQNVYEVLKNFKKITIDEKGLEKVTIDEKELETVTIAIKMLKIDHIVNYLTFFETLNVLERKGIIQIDTINDLFGSRFFLVVDKVNMFRTKSFLRKPRPIRIFSDYIANWLNIEMKCDLMK